MINIHNLSLARKLTMAAIALIAGSLILLSTVVYLTVITFGDRFLDNEIKEKSQFIQKAFSEPLWTYDQYQIDEIANSLLGEAKYTYISAIKIETVGQEVLFEKGQGELKTFLNASKNSHTKTKVIDIFKEERIIGHISIAITNEGYVKAFQDQLIIIISSALFLLLLLSQIIFYYFNRNLSAPMKIILKQVSQIQGEHYGHFHAGDLPEEFESISHALNDASSMIEKRNNDILYYTNDLEKLVEARTAALEDQMKKNINTVRLAAVGEMAADVAHEINNPLTVIDLHTSKLKKHEKELGLTPAAMASVDKIHLMVKRISKIIKGLKSISRDGNSDPMLAFSITNIVEDVKMLVEMKVKNHEIRFDVLINNPDLYAIGREVQISQVLVNLIGNAVDAIDQESDKWIKLEISEDEENVKFFVTDCGKGIPALLQEKIMDPFFTTKENNKGTGLGLSISKNIIEEHGGHLEYNQGHANTQFIFNLKKGVPAKMTA